MIEDKYFEDYKIGDVVISDTFAITAAEIKAYCKLVGDDHQIHLDPEFCRSQLGIAEVVVPGCF